MRKTRTGLRSAVVVLLAIAVLAVVCGIVMNTVFVVRNVVIDGTVSVSDEELIRLAQVSLGESIWKVDAEELRQNLESDGRFAMEAVRIEHPNTVVLTVHQRTRDGMVLNGGRILVMDSEGYVIEACNTMPADGGTFVTGLTITSYRIGSRVSSPENQLEAMDSVLSAIRNQGAGALVSELDVSDPLNLVATTRTGIRVLLGDGDNMDKKILWMKSAVTDLESRGEIQGTLDVSSGAKADYMP